MLTLCIRYTLDPNRIAHFRSYVDAESAVIRRAGGRILGYFMPTDYAGPNNEAFGLIDFDSLADYERYRHDLARDPAHAPNVEDLAASGAVLAMHRSILQRAAA